MPFLGWLQSPSKGACPPRPEAHQTMAPKLIVSHCHLSLLGTTYPWLLGEVGSSPTMKAVVTFTGQKSTYPRVPASVLAA